MVPNGTKKTPHLKKYKNLQVHINKSITNAIKPTCIHPSTLNNVYIFTILELDIPYLQNYGNTININTTTNNITY